MAIQDNKYQAMDMIILNEGGNAIKGAQAIPGNLALPIANEVIGILKQKWPSNNYAPLGSTGKKNADQMSGDIDIATDIPIEQAEEIKNWLASNEAIKSRGGFDSNFMKGLKILSIGYPWETKGSNGIVQCDLMFVPNVPRAQYFYYSPDFTKGQSQFKGSVRNIFMTAIMKNIPVQDHQTNKFPNGHIKDFWKYTIKPQEGIVCLHQSYEGKKGQELKSKHTIKEDTYVVLDDPTKFTKFILGPNATEDDMSSFEKMWEFFNSDKFYKWDEARRDKTVKEFVEDLHNENTKNQDLVDKVMDWLRKNSKADMAQMLRRGIA